MVQVVVLRRQLGLKQSQEQRVGRWWSSEDSHARVTEQLCEDDILVADPEIVEAHGQAHQLECAVGEERDDGNVEDLLLSVGIDGEQRVGVLGEMVCAVEFPKSVVLVHEAVVPVEPEVQNDSVETHLDGNPPADRARRLTCTVGKNDGE